MNRAPLVARHVDHETPLTRPRMSNEVDRHERVALTNRYVEFDGRPVIPVTGELHYSRVPRDQWEERLRLMRSGGITAVATYVFWIHHEPVRGRRSFDGNLDVAAFVALCAEVGLDVVLRIGPWCHGEVRNGGFPDWVQAAPVAHRTDDPGYLELVDEWFAELAVELAPLCGPASHVIGVQVENELYDQPGHIATIKGMARRHGIVAPIYTSTAWGGAQLPASEVLPLYGGYGDGFWVDADEPWDTTFREHFFFSHTWDDPGIGADLREHAGIAHDPSAPRTPSEDFPAATCELGGGMATAYHRRPLLSGRDIAAVAHNKIGNGSAWQGYYMYAGGLNPGPGLQESQATGYPNDLPEFDYDFHAPIGASGRLAGAHAELRRQHAFLAAFGAELADMPSSLPEVRPADVHDTETLRWAIRSDGDSAWVFLTWQQPHVPLPAYRAAQFDVVLDGETVTLPSRPVEIQPGTIAHWPVNLTVGGVRFRWLTASPLTVLEADGRTTLVVVAEAGVPVEFAIEGAFVDGASGAVREVANGVYEADASAPRRLDVAQDDAHVAVVVLPAALAAEVWVLDAPGGRRALVSEDALFVDASGCLVARAARRPEVRELDPATGSLVALQMTADAEGSDSTLDPEPLATGAPVPASYGEHANRAAAPSRDQVGRHAVTWALRLPEQTTGRRILTVDWAGDVARLEVDGRVVADRFWDGSPWEIDLDAVGGASAHQLTLAIVPLHPDAAVHLPDAAEARRGRDDAPLVALDRVRLVAEQLWTEARS